MMSDLVTLAACWTLYYLFACFFFSSRRRHTRWPRDWSSDVCSSDLSVGDAFSLRDGKSSYGEGQWATSIRYHDGRVFVLFNTNNLNGAYMLHTDDPENGVWERVEFGRFMHDPTLFFDEANDEIGRASCREGVSISGR